MVIYSGVLGILPTTFNSIYPSDELVIGYCVDEDDLDDMLVDIFNELEIDIPSLDEQSAYYEEYGYASTIEQFIRFVSFFVIADLD